MDEYAAIVESLIPLIEKKVTLTPSIFKLWFGDLELVSLNGEKAVFSTPTTLRKNILVGKYMDILTETLEEVIGFRVTIEIVSGESEPPEQQTIFEDEKLERENYEETDKRSQAIFEVLNSDAISSASSKTVLREYTFDNFVEGSSNKFAKAACFAVANNPSDDIYNPLFIWGHSGLGKTHLLCAVINHIKQKHPRLKIVYKKSEVFINELVKAIQNKATDKFKEKYRSCDVLLIDDIQFIAGKEATQEEFFHTFSTLYESGKKIILTSDRPPQEIRPLEERLRTRFEGGLIADIQPPSIELRTAIIRKKAEDLGLALSDSDVDYIASRLRSNIRQIEGALKKIHAFSSLTGAAIDKELFDRTIEIVDPGNVPKDVMIDRVLTVVSASLGVSPEAMKSKKKTASVVEARHYAIYLLRKMTDLTLKEIGEVFGRDHSTVIAAMDAMEMKIKTKKNVETSLSKMVKEIKSR